MKAYVAECAVVETRVTEGATEKALVALGAVAKTYAAQWGVVARKCAIDGLRTEC